MMGEGLTRPTVDVSDHPNDHELVPFGHTQGRSAQADFSQHPSEALECLVYGPGFLDQPSGLTMAS